jgi:hypothetical protein
MLEISRSHFCRETFVAKSRFWRHKCQIRQAGELFAASSVAAAHSLSADERPAAPRNFAAGGEFSRRFRRQARRRPRGRPDCSTLERVLGFVCTLLDAREGVKSDENRQRIAKYGQFWDDALLLGGIGPPNIWTTRRYERDILRPSRLGQWRTQGTSRLRNPETQCRE